MISDRGAPIVLASPTKRANLRGLKQPLYDQVVYPLAGAADIVFFQTPLGVAGKTLAQTNLTQSSQLGSPNEFDLAGFNFEIHYPVAAADFEVFAQDYGLILNTGLFRFYWGSQSPWLSVPLSRIPAGQSPQGVWAFDGAAAAGSRGWLGQGAPNTIYDFRVEKRAVPIGSQESFNVHLEYPGGVVPVGLARQTKVFMVGVYWTRL